MFYVKKYKMKKIIILTFINKNNLDISSEMITFEVGIPEGVSLEDGLSSRLRA